jgi:hypothetical protein
VRAERGSIMIRRTIAFAFVVGLLVSGLLGTVLADTITHWKGPGPKPWQLGDPDWPAFSKVDDSKWNVAEYKAGLLWIEPAGPAGGSLHRDRRERALDERRSLSRRYEVRILGRTIRIWR